MLLGQLSLGKIIDTNATCVSCAQHRWHILVVSKRPLHMLKVIDVVALRNELSACTISYEQTPYDIYI